MCEMVCMTELAARNNRPNQHHRMSTYRILKVNLKLSTINVALDHYLVPTINNITDTDW